MDTRRRLTLAARLAAPITVLGLGACAVIPDDDRTRPALRADVSSPLLSAPLPTLEPEVSAAAEPVVADRARPYLANADAPGPRDHPSPAGPAEGEGDRGRATKPVQSGREAIAAANAAARASSRSDAFIGGVQVFAYAPGRVYEVWTAPLRVTTLTLAPGETITVKAAGDTVRWQIGESVSGAGAGVRAHVLIKPLQAGLETNLVLTTSQRVYFITLRSGGAEAFNAAIAWDPGAVDAAAPAASPLTVNPPAPALDLSVVTPQGPIDARYRIEPRGRRPHWTPTAVFNDGSRTFIALAPDVVIDEAPALFVLAAGERQLVNYRQSQGVFIVDRVFDEAELRLGDRRPLTVRIRRSHGATR